MSDAAVAEMLGVSVAEAHALLERAGGNVEVALELYQEQLESQSSVPSRMPPPSFAPAAQPKAKPEPPRGARIAGMGSLGEGSSQRSGSSQASKPSKPSGGARIATFSSLARDDDEDKDEEYFAGSGQAIAGPGKGGRPQNDRLATFAAAKKKGATEAAAPGDDTATKIDLVFYSDGFAIRRNGELGPLRDMKNPENRAFLESVRNGTIPDELHELGENINVALVDEHDKPYPPPAKRPAPTFTGEGMTLGAAAAPPSVLAAAPIVPAGEVFCDPSQPATRIQFRLADGTRLVGNFNLTHTLVEVYHFVRLARPDARAFVLGLTHPRKDLPCDNSTIADNNLSNAVVMQRWI